MMTDCPIETKRAPRNRSALLWGRVDSNHRTHPRTDLQSVAIATMRLPQYFQEPCLKKTLQRYDLFLILQHKNKLFLNIILSFDYQYIWSPFVTDKASKKPTAVPPGYIFVATLYGIPIIGLDPKLLIISLQYVINSGVIL